MAHLQAWRRFKRMQRSTCAVAALIYAGAAIQGFRVLPGPLTLKTSLILLIPGFFALLCLVAPLQAPPLRRMLERYVMMSFKARFGQTVGSVLMGFGLLVFAAGFIYVQIAGVANGGRYPAGVFSGYGAGIGILLAQMLATSRVERDPEVRAEIEG
jgi:hypothetical protein